MVQDISPGSLRITIPALPKRIAQAKRFRGAGRAAAGYGEPVAACPQGPSTENINLFQSRQTALQISQGD
ncbi:hypothetical protein OS493_030762 [Desmophyllum pertusum]|uniref:Uncharacterized protein n=1 Tax=Desmophyllum pertusum TaxID=174260 RepID=A0A9X0CRB7_9CNID|nr:hypothetical protein OS493_030762 [Desmophyllum pertusum]